MNGQRDLNRICGKAEALRDQPYLQGSGLYSYGDDTLVATYDGIDAYKLEVFMVCTPEQLVALQPDLGRYPVHKVESL